MKLRDLLGITPDDVYVRIFENDEPVCYDNGELAMYDPFLQKAQVIAVSPILSGLDYNLHLCLRVDIVPTLTK